MNFDWILVSFKFLLYIFLCIKIFYAQNKNFVYKNKNKNNPRLFNRMYRPKKDHSPLFKYLCLWELLTIQITNLFNWNYLKQTFFSSKWRYTDSHWNAFRGLIFNCKVLKFPSISWQDDKRKHITLTKEGKYEC